MTLTKSEKFGILGTILIHLLIVVSLIYFGFNKTESVVEEGLTVNFGNIDEAAGLFEPAGETQSTNQETAPIPEATAEADKEMISQNNEESVSLTKKKEAEQIKLKEQQQMQADQNRKASAIKNQAANAFGSPGGMGSSQGTGSKGRGNQGVPTGDPNSGNSNGGGTGSGNFSLNGRSLNGGLPHPSYSIQEEGTVVVRIMVSPKGNVTGATISLKGTNTDNSTLRNAALNAAKQAKFNTIDGSQSQSGTITYRFLLK